MEELLIFRTEERAVIDEFRKQMPELSMTHYASEAALCMKFENQKELDIAVKSAMDIFSCLGISLDENFRVIYLCSEEGIDFDYKLSELAFKLVCLNGKSTNPNVAMMQIALLENNKNLK